MDMLTVWQLIENAVLAHFIFGFGVGIMSIFHPQFEDRTQHMTVRFKRIWIFTTALFLGTGVIPIMLRKAMKLREIERKPEWRIIKSGEVIGHGMRYKEAKQAAVVIGEIQQMLDGSVAQLVTDYDAMTIEIIFN
jgi:hypothetical protein